MRHKLSLPNCTYEFFPQAAVLAKLYTFIICTIFGFLLKLLQSLSELNHKNAYVYNQTLNTANLGFPGGSVVKILPANAEDSFNP